MNRCCCLLILILILCPFCMGKSNRILLNDWPQLEISVVEPGSINNISCDVNQGIQLMVESSEATPLYTQLTNGQGGQANYVLEPVSEHLQAAGWQQYFLWWLPLVPGDHCSITIDLDIDSPAPVQELAYQGEYDEPPCQPLAKGFRCVLRTDRPHLSFLLHKQDSLYRIKRLVGKTDCQGREYDWLLAGKASNQWLYPTLKENQQVLQLFPIHKGNGKKDSDSGKGYSKEDEEDGETEEVPGVIYSSIPGTGYPPDSSLNGPFYSGVPLIFTGDATAGGMLVTPPTAPLGGTGSYNLLWSSHNPLWNGFWTTYGSVINNFVHSLYLAHINNLAAANRPALALPFATQSGTGVTPAFGACAVQHQLMQGSAPAPVVSESDEGASVGLSFKTQKGKRRILFTQQQLKILNETFRKQKYVTEPERKQLAEKLKMTDKQVTDWFQNQRTKFRQTHKGATLYRTMEVVGKDGEEAAAGKESSDDTDKFRGSEDKNNDSQSNQDKKKPRYH